MQLHGDVDKKIPVTKPLVTTTVLNAKANEVKNKIPDNFKYTQELNKLIEESFEARLNQADLVNKTDFDNRLTRFNR